MDEPILVVEDNERKKLIISAKSKLVERQGRKVTGSKVQIALR